MAWTALSDGFYRMDLWGDEELQARFNGDWWPEIHFDGENGVGDDGEGTTHPAAVDAFWTDDDSTIDAAETETAVPWRDDAEAAWSSEWVEADVW